METEPISPLYLMKILYSINIFKSLNSKPWVYTCLFFLLNRKLLAKAIKVGLHYPNIYYNDIVSLLSRYIKIKNK